jgi:hypothetical protein
LNLEKISLQEKLQKTEMMHQEELNRLKINPNLSKED